MRIGLFALAVALPLNSVWAEQLRLRCDSLQSSSDIQVLVIDTDRGSVQWGDKSYFDDKRYTTQEPDTPETRSTYPIVGCRVNITQFVHISDARIEFGESNLVLNKCGSVGNPVYSALSGSPYQVVPTGRPITLSYSIDRTTGLAELGGRYQCERARGF